MTNEYWAVFGLWLGIPGVALLLVRSRRARWWVLAMSGTLIPPLLSYVSPRYHLPFVPVLAVGAAALLVAAWRGCGALSRRARVHR